MEQRFEWVDAQLASAGRYDYQNNSGSSESGPGKDARKDHRVLHPLVHTDEMPRLCPKNVNANGREGQTNREWTRRDTNNWRGREGMERGEKPRRDTNRPEERLIGPRIDVKGGEATNRYA
jgi:hypothetical protein